MRSNESLYAGKDKHERRFIKTARDCGLNVDSPKSIHCTTPVLDKNGELKKIKTVPDCIVRDRQTGQFTNVEITGGLAQWEHKHAQMRVVEQARIELKQEIPYVIICGIQLSMLYAIESIDLQLAYLRSLLFKTS